MDISPKDKNTQDTTHRPHVAQEEGRPKCGYFDPYWKVDQSTHGSQPTFRLSIRSPMEQLENGPKEVKEFVAIQEEQ